eukprot:Clim_evm22s251 gene=Clim_evmTU22s251
MAEAQSSGTSPQNANPVAVLKILLIGDSGVGKSSLMMRFLDDKFEELDATIGVDFRFKVMNVDGKTVQLTIWDTAGQERFRTLTSSYYRGAHGVILAYDVANKQTFENVTNWLDELDSYANTEVLKMLVANKVDLEYREVSTEEGQEFAQDQQMMYMECSAKSKIGVAKAFEELAHKIMADDEIWMQGQESVGAGKGNVKLGSGNLAAQEDQSFGCC